MKALAAMLAVVAIGCESAVTTPVDVRLGEDACAHCRMTVVTPRTAAQIRIAGDEPIIFDEIGCLREYLALHPLALTARVFVADHYTRQWVDAEAAIFTKSSVTTPMASGLIAHADRASRDADPAAQHGEAVASSTILRPSRVTP
jgi:copper chaperone NosL